MAGDFVDLVAWQEAAALARDTARACSGIRGTDSRDAADQLMQSAESVPANIAEGYGRGPGRDFARFLLVAAASAVELESHLRVAQVTERLAPEVTWPLVGRCRRVRAMVIGLRKAVLRRGKDREKRVMGDGRRVGERDR